MSIFAAERVCLNPKSQFKYVPRVVFEQALRQVQAEVEELRLQLHCPLHSRG